MHYQHKTILHYLLIEIQGFAKRMAGYYNGQLCIII